MDLGRRPAEVAEQRQHLVRLAHVVPVEVGLVGRDLLHHLAAAAQLAPAEPRVGVGLERPLRDRRPVARVLEVLGDALVLHHPARRRDVALLHRQHDVVLERLRAALHQQVVRRQPGAADPEARPADHVLDLVRHRVLALLLRDRLEIALVGGEHLVALVVVEPPYAGAVLEAPVVVLHGRHPLEHLPAALEAGLDEHRVQGALGVVEREPELLVVLAVVEGLDLLGVGARVGLDQLADGVVGQGLDEAQQRQAGGHPLEVPGEVAEVRLVEVVDVEHDDAGVVQVGAVVLGVEVALDPDPAGALVGVAVLHLRHVGVEQAGAAAVERERVLRHLAELAPEGPRVGLDQVLEGVHEDAHDLLGAVHAR